MTLSTIIKDLKTPGIARRMVVYILIYSSAVTLLSTFTQLYFDYRADVDVLEERLRQIEYSFAESISDAVWNVDYQQVAVTIEGVLRLPDIHHVSVSPRGEDERIVAGESDPAEDLIWRRMPLSYESSGRVHELGSMQVGATREGIYKRLRKKVFIVLIAQAIKTFLVTAFMLVIFNSLIIKHLDTLANFARNLRLGGQSDELRLNRRPPRHEDELDLVVNAFNQMQDELGQAYEELLSSNKELDQKTKELEAHKENLERLVAERTEELRAAQQSLLASAHRAGMAEIAVGVLHNVGNALNSLNISLQLVDEKLQASNISRMSKANELLQGWADGSKGTPTHEQLEGLLTYYRRISQNLNKEREVLLQEFSRMENHIDLIREVIQEQRSYATYGSFEELLDPADVVREVLRMEERSLTEAEVTVETDFQESPRLELPKPKLYFIIMQLVRNGMEAMRDKPPNERVLRISCGQDEEKREVVIWIEDQGVGIDPRHESLIFEYGFTTKSDGQGFGLHTCANAMTEIGGKLGFESRGVGLGAVFFLRFPIREKKARRRGA